jgi:hypothetical protein
MKREDRRVDTLQLRTLYPRFKNDTELVKQSTSQSVPQVQSCLVPRSTSYNMEHPSARRIDGDDNGATFDGLNDRQGEHDKANC